KRFLYFTVCTLIFLSPLFPDIDLGLDSKDFRIEQSIEGGYHLWIRKKPDVNSVLLTESTADPARRAHSYTLRNPEYNRSNGDERRILDGKVLEGRGLYFLMDSTPEDHKELGKTFHIFIPYIVEYGYAWSRKGEIQILDGTFLNIRSFSKPYADYGGAYMDNPFMLRIEQLVIKEPGGEFMEEAVESFTGIAEKGGGKALRSSGKEDLIQRIGEIIDKTRGSSLDLVLALDTTRSMH
ncbi:unnamed protein product, partial [marine sediment metagenome]